MSIASVFLKGWNVTKNAAIKHGPTLALCAGSGLIVVGTVDACRKTLKASALIEDHNAKMDDIHQAIELASKEEIVYTDNDRKKDTAKAYAGTAYNFAKLYWRPTLLIGGGFASIFAGFRVIKARHVATLGAFATISDQFNEYRGRVISEYGRDIDKKFISGNSDGATKTKLLIHGDEEDENSEDEELDVEAINLDDITQDDFCFDFNYKCKGWENSFILNDNYLTSLRNRYQSLFNRDVADHVFVGDIWKEMGYDDPKWSTYDERMRAKLSLGSFYGWMNRPGAEIEIDWEPYIVSFSADEASEQFPMIIPIDVEDEKQFMEFRRQYFEDQTKVGYLVWFNVDTDDNGVPREIYHDVYGYRK